MAKRLWDKGAAVDSAVHDFTVGTDPEIDLELARWDVLAQAAHSHVLLKLKILSAPEHSSMLKALGEILAEVEAGRFVIPRELEDVQTTIEAKLTEKLGETGKKINTGRSRNEVLVPLRLYLKNSILETSSGVLALADALDRRVRENGKLPLPGYTHFQKAMPASVGMWLQSFFEWCLEILGDGLNLYESIDSNPLGTGSGFGLPFDLDRDLSTRLLSFARVQRNPMYAHSSRGRFELKTLRWRSDIAAMIEKLCSDLMLYTTSEFGFVSLPESITTGSSIMPQKRNPDVVELLRGNASKVRALESEVAGVISKLPSSYHRDYQLTKEPLVQAVKAADAMLGAVIRCVDGMKFHSDKLSSAMSDDLFVTYAVYRDVRAGKSFREAYLDTAKKFAAGESLDPALRSDFALIEAGLEREFTQALAERDALAKKFAVLRDQFDKIGRTVGLA